MKRTNSSKKLLALSIVLLVILIFQSNCINSDNSDSDDLPPGKKLASNKQQKQKNLEVSNVLQSQQKPQQIQLQSSIQKELQSEALSEKQNKMLQNHRTIHSIKQWRPRVFPEFKLFVLKIMKLAIIYSQCQAKLEIKWFLSILFQFFGANIGNWEPLFLLKDLTFFSAFFPSRYPPFVKLATEIRKIIPKLWTNREKYQHKEVLVNFVDKLKRRLRQKRTGNAQMLQLRQILLTLWQSIQAMGTFEDKINCGINIYFLLHAAMKRGPKFLTSHPYTYGFIQSKGMITESPYPFRYREDRQIGLSKNQNQLFGLPSDVSFNQHYRELQEKQNKRQQVFVIQKPNLQVQTKTFQQQFRRFSWTQKQDNKQVQSHPKKTVTKSFPSPQLTQTSFISPPQQINVQMKPYHKNLTHSTISSLSPLPFHIQNPHQSYQVPLPLNLSQIILLPLSPQKTSPQVSFSNPQENKRMHAQDNLSFSYKKQSKLSSSEDDPPLSSQDQYTSYDPNLLFHSHSSAAWSLQSTQISLEDILQLEQKLDSSQQVLQNYLSSLNQRIQREPIASTLASQVSPFEAYQNREKRGNERQYLRSQYIKRNPKDQSEEQTIHQQNQQIKKKRKKYH